MTTFENKTFEGFEDWSTGRVFTDTEFVNCRFNQCAFSAVNFAKYGQVNLVQYRSIARRIKFVNCRVEGVGFVGPGIVEDSVIDGLKVAKHIQTCGTVFSRFVVKGLIDKLMITPYVDMFDSSPGLQQSFDDANREFYEGVDWALDISEGNFRDCDIRGVPAQLVRRDVETQVVLTSHMKLGNNKWETAKFNTRQQVIELGLGSSATDAGLWKVNYDYGELAQNGFDIETAKNTGNIARQTLTIPGTSFVQSYRYDSLYRLKEAVEKTGANQNWIQNWDYDRYGNRTLFTQNIGGNTSAWNPTVVTGSNRFGENQGFTYDKNGNVVNDIDPLTSHSRLFTFNGDNKQIAVKDTSTNITKGQYFYDGEGKRVKKINPETGETTVFVYSSGKLIAEYSTAAPQANPSINYTTTDHLGSPRVITDAIGQVKSRRDFLPFGEEVTPNVGNRSASPGYSATDNIRQKFTGYQKDTEPPSTSPRRGCMRIGLDDSQQSIRYSLRENL